MASIRAGTQVVGASLLDRLTERSSKEVSDATLGRGELPIADLEAAIFRDLNWLLTTTSLSASRDLSSWPNVRRSVLNYGIHALPGKTISNAHLAAIEREMKRAIVLYEPRLAPDSVEIHIVAEESRNERPRLQVTVTAQYVSGDQLIPFEFATTMDFETGRPWSAE